MARNFIYNAVVPKTQSIATLIVSVDRVGTLRAIIAITVWTAEGYGSHGVAWKLVNDVVSHPTFSPTTLIVSVC